MRLKIKLSPLNKDGIILPIQYNEILQGLIYRSLEKGLSAKIHDFGFEDPKTKRKFKLFTFSRLLSSQRPRFNNGKIHFSGDLALVVASPVKEFIQSLAQSILMSEFITFGEEKALLQAVEVLALPNYQEKVFVKTLSPITVYSTLKTPQGKKKTYFYSPFEREFEDLIIDNLNKKLRALGNKGEFKGAVKPFRVGTRNQRVILYKNTVIKAWDGIFELSLPKELFEIAFTCGLGAKNSQGFGCIELWEG
ncbi:MAG: CRISPR-associated endoribonuclease Cas6 [Caldimicrobium sp.]